MSDESVDPVRRLLDIFARRDHEGVFEFYDFDIEWDATAWKSNESTAVDAELAVSLVSRGSTVATRVFAPTGDVGWKLLLLRTGGHSVAPQVPYPRRCS
jgi:ketosteroid isomerase-like protein